MAPWPLIALLLMRPGQRRKYDRLQGELHSVLYPIERESIELELTS